MTILILGGTAEARQLAAALVADGVDVISSLAGRVGAPNLPPGRVRVGGFGGAGGLADYLRREHGVVNRFIVWGAPHDLYVRSAVAAAFPGLADSEIVFHDGTCFEQYSKMSVIRRIDGRGG